MSQNQCMEGLGKRLRAAVKGQKGLTLDVVAKRLSVSIRTLHNYFNDEREPGAESILVISELTGVSVADLIKRDDAEPAFDPDQTVGDDPFVRVRLLDVELSAGPGAFAVTEDDAGGLAFRLDWLNRNGINPDQASLVRVSGSSMEPTLHNGSMVLIDHRHREPLGKSVYACRMGEALFVKRLEVQPIDQTILVHSDNPAAQTIVVHDPDEADFEIIGKVVWSANTWTDD